jgi:hypothetical protein
MKIPIDSFLLTSFDGKIDPKLIGPPIPDVPILFRNFNMILKSVPFNINTPIATGDCTMTFWKKKTAK